VNWDLRRREIDRRLSAIRSEKRSLLKRSLIAVRARPPRAHRVSTFGDYAIPDSEARRLSQAVEASNAKIDSIQRQNERARIEIENSYEQKLQQVAVLMNAQDENEKLQLRIDEMKTIIALLQDRHTGVLAEERRLQKVAMQNKRQSELLQKEQIQLAEAKERIHKKSDSIERRNGNMIHRKCLLQKEEENIKLFRDQIDEMKEKVKVYENQIVECERKCDALNDALKKEEVELDNTLFHASSMRIDSRIQRLQEMLETRTDSVFTRTATQILGLTLGHAAIKQSALADS
jgi:chromosome segregation ATPase